MKALWVILILILALSGAAASAEDRKSVAVPVANIRSGPGQGYDILWSVEKYYPLIVLKMTGKWYYLKDFEGDEGWIYASLVDDTPTVISTRDECNVRSGPGIENSIVFLVDRGVPFKILDRQDTWIQIEHKDGDRGWISKTLVW